MAFQEFELNMIPHGDMPSFYASQYETGRPIIIDIMMGEDAFACDELYIELHCRKVDDNIVTLQPDSVDGNQVTFIGTDQLFACPGKNVAEVCLYADETKDTSLGSLNFFIEVEPDPLAGGLTSESSIYDLRDQIEEITAEVIGEDYYDKTEVDDLLDLKADKSNTYTKTEVDNALNLKADKSTTYTKSQVDSALALKADASSVYTKGQTDTLLNAKANTSDLATVATSGSYNDLTNKPTIPAAQVQSDYEQADSTAVDYIKNKPDLSVYATTEDLADAIYSLLPIDTASGAIANFNTEIGADLVDCKAYIVASQPTGTPTPSNPLPISGHTESNITRCGVNLWDEVAESGRYDTDTGVERPDAAWTRSKNFIPVKPGSEIYIKSSLSIVIYCYGLDKSYISKTNRQNATFTVPSGVYYLHITWNDNAYNNDISFNYPSTDTSYQAHTNNNTVTISFGQTVYGGNIDLTTGVLTSPYFGFVANNDLVVSKVGTSGGLSTFVINFASNNFPSGSDNSAKSSHFSTSIPSGQSGRMAQSSTDIYCVIDNTLLATDDAPGFLAWLISNGVTFYYTRTTPVTYQLTPTQVRALVGVNNVFNDTNGNTEVQFKDSIQHYIDVRT